MEGKFDEAFLTIREWASENGLAVTEEQMQELHQGLNAAREMRLYQTGWTLGDKSHFEREQATKMEKLEGTIRQLEGFIKSKGYRVSADANSVTEYTTVPCGSSHWASHDVTRDYVKEVPANEA